MKAVRIGEINRPVPGYHQVIRSRGYLGVRFEILADLVVACLASLLAYEVPGLRCRLERLRNARRSSLRLAPQAREGGVKEGQGAYGFVRAQIGSDP